MIKVDVCPQRFSTYRCLPEVAKVDQLINSGKPLEFSYSPHHREELLRIYTMMTDAPAYEWLVPGHPGTPTA
eukprot:5841996-Amphidinium_carterae.1